MIKVTKKVVEVIIHVQRSLSRDAGEGGFGQVAIDDRGYLYIYAVAANSLLFRYRYFSR